MASLGVGPRLSDAWGACLSQNQAKWLLLAPMLYTDSKPGAKGTSWLSVAVGYWQA